MYGRTRGKKEQDKGCKGFKVAFVKRQSNESINLQATIDTESPPLCTMLSLHGAAYLQIIYHSTVRSNYYESLSRGISFDDNRAKFAFDDGRGFRVAINNRKRSLILRLMLNRKRDFSFFFLFFPLLLFALKAGKRQIETREESLRKIDSKYRPHILFSIRVKRKPYCVVTVP